MNYKEILSLVNKRYVLLKEKNDNFRIYDKLQGAFLFLNDPIINYNELVKELKRRSSKIYSSTSDLPHPVEKPIDWTLKEDEKNENIVIRKMFNSDGELSGVVVTYFSYQPIKTIKQKELIEKRLVDYIHDNIFKNEGISIYSDIYRDIASVLAINNINNLNTELKYLKLDIS